MSILRVTKAALLASVFSISFGYAATAADLILSPEPIAEQYVDLVLPAVSGINGKLEIDFGGITDPDSATFRAAGSLSVPIGERFGVQGDVSIGSIDGNWAFGGAVHAFTRDPSSYLLGVTAGVVVADGARLAAVGPEAELYLDRISLEGWAGWAAIDYDDVLTPNENGFFAIGDVAWYPTDDWRISLGGASILGRESLKLATEYQFSGLGFPLSGVGEVRAYDTGAYSFRVGIKGYLGDSGKSLIDRHRQDDPPNRALDLFSAAGDLLTEQVGPGGPPDEACPSENESWQFVDGEWMCVPDVT
ncbi:MULTISPECIES: hypothetical protein [unclassified Devosia]|uniref:hypothetical protein n=1 Tax=unclassified Devosia TaxID=196773 RepID=UPI000AC747CE|nr:MULTISPECIES: hypothetical protein [unclassified Devosia]MBN9362613.1 hypothetical protein [Devosia sp.]